jgi:hypothetical protein
MFPVLRLRTGANMDFPTEAEVRAGIETYNRFVADTWSYLQGELDARVAKAGKELAESNDRIKEIERIKLDLESPPQLRFDGALASPGRLKVIFALPGAGSWTLRIRARVVVGWPFSRRGSIIELDIKRLRIKARIDVERQSPIAVELIDSQVEVELGDVQIGASNFLLKLFSGLLSFFLEVIESTIEDLVRKALEDGLPDRRDVETMAKLGLADQAIEVPDETPDLTGLDETAAAVATRIAGAHMPYGTVLNLLVPKDSPDGDPVGIIKVQDSAIWTGFFLAGEVYRYMVTREQGALANISKALDGIDRLIHLTGEDGLLSRLLIPLSATEAVRDLEEEMEYMNHQAWLFTSGDYRCLGHVTRDQYAGAFLGAGLAAVLLDGQGEEADLRDQARQIIIQMASYLDDRHFCPCEATVDPESGNRLTSVVYLTNPQHLLAILRLASHLDPDRFAERYEELYPIWSLQWLFAWAPSLDPHSSYFKFNLSHSMALLLLLPEIADKPGRRERLAQWLPIMRNAIRYHANAYFNLIELIAADEDDADLSRPRAEIEHETRHLVADAFERPPTISKTSADDFPDVVKVEYRGLSGEGRPETIAKMPVAVARRPGADFVWQRSPFLLRVVWSKVPKDPAIGPPRIDQTLPFWMARRLGL